MTRFAAINLATLPAPEAIEQISFEVILAEMKGAFLAAYTEARVRNPELPVIDTLNLETEPLNIAFQTMAYREVLVRQVGNDKYKAASLAFATSNNLEVKAAELGVVRKLIDVGDPNASPPIAPVYESDIDFRFRAQLAWEGLSVAGSYGAYLFQGLTAHADVLDVGVFGPESGEDVDPGQVRVTILSREEGGTASPELLGAVEAYISGDLRRPLTDHVLIESASITSYAVEATVKVRPGASAEVVRKAAEDAVTLYTEQQYGIGQAIRRSRLAAALYVGDDAGRSPVVDVTITQPAADIVTGARAAPKCTGVTVTVEVV
ncbi:baseplate assembly protein [Arvimicrobium flavum]|uniref:baseplate assembly protein n=1 Tax=Arvimicrobium flavum TaxID=3393320 RepID=UPI00237B91E5|nr:baseplate J/gp47 family protein [Mesorhizobium shangrilense]